MCDARINPCAIRGGKLLVTGVLVLITASLAVGCQEVPDRGAPGPPDRAFNRAEAQGIQDSLQSITQAGQFIALMTSDPFNPSPRTAEVRMRLSGEAAYSSSIEREGTLTTHFRLDPEKGSRSRFALRLCQPSDATDSVMKGRDTVLVEQQNQCPTVEADVGQGRRRYRSRSGYLTLISQGNDRLMGRFYFEMQRPGEAEENWFELVGTFNADPSDGVEPAS